MNQTEQSCLVLSVSFENFNDEVCKGNSVPSLTGRYRGRYSGILIPVPPWECLLQ
jgi:hypothetical protein